MSKRTTFIKDNLSKDAVSEGDRIVAAAKSHSKGFAKSKDSTTTEQPPTQPSTTAPEKPADEVETPPATPPAPAPAPAPTLDASQIAEMIQMSVKAAVAEQQSQNKAAIDTIKAQNQAELDAIKAEADAAKLKADQAEASKQSIIAAFGLDKFTGQPEPVKDGSSKLGFPMFNQHSTTRSDEPIGSVKEYLEASASMPKIIRNTRSGQMATCDRRELDSFVRENKRQVAKDLESWGKNLGLFRGTNQISTDAATMISNIPGAFLETISSMVRTGNRPAFVFHQFCDYQFDFAARLGGTISISRAAYLPGPTQSSDRLLSGGGVFYPIDSGRQPIQMGGVQSVIKEWGLGKDSTCPPVGVPTFVEAYSIHDLMAIIDRNIMHDYYMWDDMRVLELWDATSRVVYNNLGEVTTSPSDIVTGRDGTCTEDFMFSMFGYMQDAQIPTMPDGKYIAWLNSKSITQFKKSLRNDWAPHTPQQVADLTNMLNPGLLGDTGRISGYVGDYCGFHVFTSNNWGAVSGRGLQTEALNSTTLETRKNYFAGANTIGKGVGMPVEIRQETTNFNRLDSFIWLEHSDHVALDVDPTGFNDVSNIPQQLRVIEFRNLSSKI